MLKHGNFPFSPLVNSYGTFMCFGSYLSSEIGKEYKYKNNYVLIKRFQKLLFLSLNYLHLSYLKDHCKGVVIISLIINISQQAN